MNLDIRVNGTTILTGLIGNPIEHTVSPLLHNSLFSATGINGIYIPLKVQSGCLDKAINGLRNLGFAGFNITIPYKEEILAYMDEVTDEVRLLGAANTVKILNGRLFAYNTDGDGFIRAFEEETGTGFKQKSVCIIGAGGTARALAVKIAIKGARSIAIINRTISKAEELASHVNKVLTGRGCSQKVTAIGASNTQEALKMLDSCDIIVNTTPIGMFPNTDVSPLPEGFIFRSGQVVYDAIYNPVQTRLLKSAKADGARALNGAGMLFYQGLAAFEIFNDISVPLEVSAEISREFLKYLEV